MTKPLGCFDDIDLDVQASLALDAAGALPHGAERTEALKGPAFYEKPPRHRVCHLRSAEAGTPHADALSDSDGIISTGTMPTPNATAFTIMKTIAAI